MGSKTRMNELFESGKVSGTGVKKKCADEISQAKTENNVWSTSPGIRVWSSGIGTSAIGYDRQLMCTR